MRLPRTLVSLTLAVLVASVGLGATDVTPPVRADDQPGLALPSGESREANRSLLTDDAVSPAPPLFDVDAAGEAAMAHVAAFDETTWDITALAESLGPDAADAFEFVRDRIAFDPYPGVLRGAHGALAARAGNAWDRALLLQALLAAAGHEARLARADVDGMAASRLRSRALEGVVEPISDPAAAGLLGLDLEAIVTRARRDHALLLEALGTEADDLGAAAGSSVTGAPSGHAWVRLRQEDGTWLDLDPSLPEMEPGDLLAQTAVAVGEPPAELNHSLLVMVVAESLIDGIASEDVVLEHHLDAATASDSEIWLTFQPEASGLSGSIFEAMDAVDWVPVLSVDGDDVSGRPFRVGAGDEAGDFFFGGGPELIGLRIELVSQGPGLEPLTGTRVLLDRASLSARAAGTIVAESLEPLPQAGEPLPALAGIHQVLVSNGAADLRAHAVNRAIALGYGSTLVNDDSEGLALPDLLYPLAVANQSLVVASERLLTEGIGREDEARAFVGRARAYLISLVPYPAVPDGTAIITDLALDDIDVVLADDAPASLGAQVRLWHGVLQSALETQLSLGRARAVSRETARVDSISLRMEGTPTLIHPDEIDSVDTVALRGALDAGQLALIVGPPAEGAFWTIEPSSGRTRSVMEPGLRVGFNGVGNYTNSSLGGPRYVISDQYNTIGTIKDGRFTPAGRRPPSRCSGGTEYVIILGCVSIPASMTVGMANATVVTAIVAWATAILELLLLT